jgi:signal transduction histidine kinase
LLLANTGQSELRAVITDIRTNRLTPAGLVSALEQLATDVGSRNGLDIRLALDEEPALSSEKKEALVVIVREALHNVVRHSDAHRVDIVLELGGEGLMLLVKDDGHGFDPSRTRPGHFGLQSMRERAAGVGGTLTLDSVVRAGTQLRVTIPLPVSANG